MGDLNAQSPRILAQMTARRSKISMLAGVVVIGLIAGAAIYITFFRGIQPGLCFIARLQSGGIGFQDVTRVDVLRCNRIGAFPFTKREYDALERSAMSDTNVQTLLSLLRDNSFPHTPPRNHPGTLHYGILRVLLRNGEYFYLYCQILVDKSGKWTSVDANTAYSTNPNGAKHYESTELAKFLEREDPWFGKR